MPHSPVQPIDLQAQRSRLEPGISDAIQRVLDHGKFIMGPEVAALEEALAAQCGGRHTITCSSGTDALLMGLMAAGVGHGDAVFVPAFTFAATAEVVVRVGAVPFFVDVRSDTFDMDADSLEATIAACDSQGLRPAAVIPVDLFGQPADYRTILPIARRNNLFVLCDAAQSFGATLDNAAVGTLGDATAVSFFPTKPLGCYGDGGAVLTDDDELATRLRSLRVHGKGKAKYDNVRIGLNARLDTIQAAVLLEKLRIFKDEVAARQLIAARYSKGLAPIVPPPVVRQGTTSVWAQYTIAIDDRDRVLAHLQERSIAAGVYYPTPLNRQEAYKYYPLSPQGAPNAEQLARQVVSLPLHPYLDEQSQDSVIAAVRDSVSPSTA